MRDSSMEQVKEIALTNPDTYPDENVLEKLLGKSFIAYKKLLDLFESYELSHEWRYYRDGKAWLCKVQKKTKTIIWMSAWNGYMKATIYISEKSIHGIYDLDLPNDEKQRIEATKNVGKLKPCSFDIKNQKVLPILEKVIVYKIGIK